MKKLIKRILPEKSKQILINYRKKIYLRKNYLYDMRKYLNYSFEFGGNKTRRHFQADLIFYYHKIEKGLSLPNPRVGFGNKNVEVLIDKLEYYTKNYGWDDVSLVTLNALYAYYNFNKENNFDLPILHKKLEMFKKIINNTKQISAGGVREIQKSEILSKSSINFRDFAYSRYSIRNFAQGEVSLELIKNAVYDAQKTPTVCNRQSAKVYVYTDDQIKKEVLKYQNGNRGFGHNADKILIVTTDLRDFRGIIERNQCFIDGGLYAMSLLYALHARGVGTCPLNLCLTFDTEEKLKQVAKIGKHEALIMMIAVGKIPEKLKVASSPRRNVDEVMTIY